MAENITLNNIATFQNDTSAANTYNNNNAAIVNAFADVLSRSGVAPNQMSSTLDMNNNQIINLPAPTTAGSPARLIDVTTPGSITVNTATTGTSGHVVPFLDGVNTWSGAQTLTLSSLGTGTGLTINETVSGTNALGVNINAINISDTLVAAPQFSNGFLVQHSFGGAGSTGGRQAIAALVNQTAATTGGNTNRDYVAIAGVSQASVNDTGSSPNSSATAAGSYFGGSFVGLAGSSATSLFNVSGSVHNTQMASGSSTWSKSIAQFSSNPTDVANGTGVNTMLWLFNQSGSTAKWTNAILIDNASGFGAWPMSTTGTIIKTAGGGTTANGVDMSGTTFTGQAFLSQGFAVNPSGVIQSGGPAVSLSGQLQLNGSTSGNITITGSSTSNLLNVSQPIQTGIVGSIAGGITIAGLTSGSASISCSATAGTLQMGGNNFAIFSNGSASTAGNSMTVSAGTAPSAGGTTGVGYTMSSTANFGIFFGSGAPTLTAAQGSIYLRTDGSSTSTRLYVNTTGSNVWTNFTSAT